MKRGLPMILLLWGLSFGAFAQLTAPFTESFNSTSIPTGWSSFNDCSSTSTNGFFKYGGTLGYDGSICTDHTGQTGSTYAWVDGSSPYPCVVTLETDSIDVSNLTGVYLEFFLFSYNNTYASSGYNTVTVNYYDGSAWNDSVFIYSGSDPAWQYKGIDLSSYTVSGDVVFQFVINKNASTPFYNDIAFDDIAVKNPPTCPFPNGFMVNSVDTTGATLSWGSVGSAGSYKVIYGAPGFNPATSGSIDSTTVDSITLSGLTPSTNYEAYLYADCGSGDYSDTVGPVSFATLCYPVAGGTYTINSNLPTGGTNFANFSDFSYAVTCGGITGPVIANVAPFSGPYQEQAYFGSIPGISSTNTITINGNGETLEFSATVSSERYTLAFDGASHIEVNNLNIEANGSSYGFGIWMTGGSEYITIDSCTVSVNQGSTSSSFSALASSTSATSATSVSSIPAQNVTYTNNIFEGGYYCVTLAGQSNSNTATNVLFENNIVRDFVYYGIYGRYLDNSLIKGNDISRPNRQTAFSFYGMYFYGAMYGCEVTGNAAHNVFDQNPTYTGTVYAYYFSSVEGGNGQGPLVISNNLLYNVNMDGTQYGIYMPGTSDSVLVYHNTISLDNVNATGSSTIRGMYITSSSSSTDVEIKNNIFNISEGGSGTKHCLYVSSSTPNYDIDYNQYNMASQSGTNSLAYMGGNRTSISDIQTNTSYETNGVDGDPLFTNPATGDMTPQGPAGNNNAAPLSAIVPVDFAGVTRPANSADRGALEFSPLFCLQPYSISADTLKANSAYFTWTNDAAADSVEIEYGPVGFVQGTGTKIWVADSSLNISGLTPLTCYDIYFTTWCGGTIGNGTAGPITFCTTCPAVLTAPLTENFDGQLWTAGNFGSGDVFDPCWAGDPYYTAGNVYRWIVNSGTTGSFGTGPNGDNTTGNDNYLYTEASFTGTGDTAFLYSPVVDLSPLTRPMISFYYHMFGSEIDALHLDVWDGNTWTNDIVVIVGEQQTANSDPFEEAVALLQPYINDTVQFRWWAVSEGCCGGDISIDDVSIIDAPLCSDPTSLAIDSVSASSGTVSWASYNSTFNIEWGPCGFLQGSGVGTVVNNVSNPVTITGLAPNSCYDVYVNDPCGNSWVGPISFTTDCLSQLSGTYTVGGPAGPNNFATLDSAIAELNGCGINGPVVFDLAPGTYNTSINLIPIDGSSATNTVTFRGAGATQDTIDGNGQPAALQLFGTENVIFKHLTFANLTSGWGVLLSGGTRNVLIDSCIIAVNPTTTSSADNGIVASSSTTSAFGYDLNAYDVTISNSTISGGYYGARINGASSTSRIHGFSFINNDFVDQYYYGMFLYYVDSLTVHNNTVTGSSARYGLYMYYPNHIDIQGNWFATSTYGMYASQTNTRVTPSVQNKVVNNMIDGGTYGIYFSTADSLDIFHNTIRGGTRGMYLIGTHRGHDVRNNIFVSTGSSEAFYYSTSNPIDVMDYNLYYAPSASNIGRNGTTSYSDLSSWQTGQPSMNANSVEGDPVFAGPSDLHIIGTLPNDTGDNSVGVVVDIDGDIRPAAGATRVDIGADEYTPKNWDAEFIALLGADGGCGDSAIALDVVVRNLGQQTITTLPVSVSITGDVTQTLNTTYTTSIPSLGEDTISMGSFNIYNGGVVNFNVGLNLANDQEPANDSGQVMNVAYIPFEPLTMPVDTFCSNADSGYFVGFPIPGIQYGWYQNTTDTVPVSTADTFRFSMAGQRTWYVEYQTNADSLLTTLAGGNGQSGNAFDVLPNSTIAVNAVGAHIDASTQETVNVYYKTGTYVGSATSLTNWTLHESVTVTGQGSGSLTYVPFSTPLTLNAGQTYGMMVVITSGASVDYTNGNSVGSILAQNNDLTIYEGSGVSWPLGSNFNPRNWNGMIYYGSAGCSNIRNSVTVGVDSAYVLAAGTAVSSGVGSLTANFDASTTVGATNYMWDFGDGNNGTGMTTSHTYAQGGDYVITLIAMDSICNTSDTVQIPLNGLSVDETLLSHSLNIFPNPTQGQVQVTFDIEGVQEIQVRLLNLIGQEIALFDHGSRSGQFKHSYDLSDQPDGMYLIEIRTQQGVVTRRINLHR